MDPDITFLPRLSIPASRVLEVCNNYQTSPDDLYRIFLEDKLLLDRLLKLVNSVFYEEKNTVTSPARAMIMLGMNTVKNLAVSTVQELSPDIRGVIGEK